MTDKNESGYSQLEHLKLIEQQIQRLSEDSFKIKNWFITLISASFVILIAQPKSRFYLLLIIFMFFTCLFWYLDAYYLSLEKSYRELYSKVVNGSLKINKFTLDISEEELHFKPICVAVTNHSILKIYKTIFLLEIIVGLYFFIFENL